MENRKNSARQLYNREIKATEWRTGTRLRKTKNKGQLAVVIFPGRLFHLTRNLYATGARTGPKTSEAKSEPLFKKAAQSSGMRTIFYRINVDFEAF